nr:hypothetical protein [Oryza sativa Japonica Group]
MRKCCRMKVESSSREPALHCHGPNIKEDYRVFFQHVCPVGNGGFVLEHEGKAKIVQEDQEEEDMKNEAC